VSRRPRFAIVASPGFIAAVLVLLANDHVLKSAFPGVLTGKLSDVSGLFVVGALTVALVPSRPTLGLGAIATAFVWWKSPLSQPLIDAWNTGGPFTIGRVVDWTDLLTLPTLPLTLLYARSAFRIVPAGVIRPAMLAVTALAIMATSKVPPTGVYKNDLSAMEHQSSSATYVTLLKRADVLAAFYHAGFQVRYGLFEDIDLNSRVRCGVDDSPTRAVVSAELIVHDTADRTVIRVDRVGFCRRSAPDSKNGAISAVEKEILAASLPNVRRVDPDTPQ
jgi:hypothetical protein